MCLDITLQTQLPITDVVLGYKVVEKQDDAYAPAIRDARIKFRLGETYHDHILARFFPRLARRLQRKAKTSWSNDALYRKGFHVYNDVDSARLGKEHLEKRAKEQELTVSYAIIKVQLEYLTAWGYQNVDFRASKSMKHAFPQYAEVFVGMKMKVIAEIM